MRILIVHVRSYPLFLRAAQDTVLFNETLYRNIAYGRPGASRAEGVGARHILEYSSPISRRSRPLELRGGQE